MQSAIPQVFNKVPYNMYHVICPTFQEIQCHNQMFTGNKGSSVKRLQEAKQRSYLYKVSKKEHT